MPSVTYIEAKDVLERIDMKISDYRRKIDNLLNNTTVTEVSEPVTSGEEVIVERKAAPVTETLEELHAKLDQLFVERAKVKIAKLQFISSQKFNY